jgi:hypothetical protein
MLAVDFFHVDCAITLQRIYVFRRASGCTFSCSPNRRNVGRGDDSRYSRTARSRSSLGYFLGAGNRAFLPGSQDRTSLRRLRRSEGISRSHRRLYEACGDIPPAELEAAHYRHHAALAEAGHSTP